MTANTIRDTQSKIREDPLLSIKKREQFMVQSVLSNPVKLKQLQKQQLAASESNKKKEKKKKKSSKKSSSKHDHHRSHHRDGNSSESEDDKHRRVKNPGMFHLFYLP